MRYGDGIKQGVKAAVPGAKARELAVVVRFFLFFSFFFLRLVAIVLFLFGDWLE